MKYCVIRNKALASAIAFLTNERYYTYEDRDNINKKVYSFQRTKKFDYAMSQIDKIAKEIEKMN